MVKLSHALCLPIALLVYLGFGRPARAQCGDCPGSGEFDLLDYCDGGACSYEDFMDLLISCYTCPTEEGECVPPPEYISAMFDALRAACCPCVPGEHPYCDDDCTWMTDCEIAEMYLDKVGHLLTDDEKCLARMRLNCPNDCQISPPPWYPIDDPIGPGGGADDPILPWDFGGGFGDPFGEPPSYGGVNLAKGTFHSTEIDIDLPSPGFSWRIGRANLLNRKNDTTGHYTEFWTTYQGFNWMQVSQPRLVTDPGGYFGRASSGSDRIVIHFNTEGVLQFLETSEGSGNFMLLGDGDGAIKRVDVSGQKICQMYDTRGTITEWFSDLDSGNGDAGGSIWRITDAAGNRAYVGHPTDPSLAASQGYNTDGYILMAVDPADRRYTYTYSTAGDRLESVQVHTKPDGSWYDPNDEPTSTTLVAEVRYTYYTSTEAAIDEGVIGDLMLVEVDLPLSDPTVKDTRVRYFRYNTVTTGSDTPELPHMLRLIVGEEGARAYDWAQDSGFDPETDLPAAAEGDLKPYAEKFLVYGNASNDDPRVTSFFSNGDCGCGGQSDGVFTLSFEGNEEHNNQTTSYDAEWLYRTVMLQPDDTWRIIYSDELYQTMAEVISDGDPEATPTPDRWITQYIRDAEFGWTLERRTPANATGYDHNDGNGDAFGEITSSGTAGLIDVFEYFKDGDLAGNLFNVKWKGKGTGTTDNPENLVSTTYYLTQSLKVGVEEIGGEDYDLTIPRTHPHSRWTYTEETTVTADGTTAPSGAYETTTTYVYYDEDSEDPTSVDHITPWIRSTAFEAVSTAHNGSGNADHSSVLLLKDGRVQFARAPDGIIAYTGYDPVTGQVDEIVRDVNTSVSGYDPNPSEVLPSEWATEFDSNGGGSDELHQATEFTYDPQGRVDQATLHAHSTGKQRVTETSYARLADRRTTVISIPRVVAGTSTEYYGPAGYSVFNHAGRAEVSGMLSLDSSMPPTSDPATWIDEGESDALAAVGSMAAVARWSTVLYEESGVRATKSRAYHTIPSTEDGSASDYDQTEYAHDDMGRVVGVKDPTGTVQRTQYDALSRVSSTKLGTNDNGESNGLYSSGVYNLVTTELLEYDGGEDGGNSYLTQVTQRVQGGTTGERVTSFVNDARGRTIVVEAPLAPHSVSLYDNLGRVTASATYSDVTGFTAAADPTDQTNYGEDRMSLSRTYYDERGQVYESREYKINQSSGAVVTSTGDVYLYSKSWYDSVGRALKTAGEQIGKTVYDRLGRPTHSFVIATVDDSVYSDAFGVSDDVVLEESQTAYSEDTGSVLLSASISRFHDDYGTGLTTGPLDLDSENSGVGDPLIYTDSDILGRIQIIASWYDEWDRLEDTVQYGTYDGDTFSYPSAPPTRSADALRNTMTYSDDGTLLQTEDPESVKTRFEYDGFGRQVAVVSNYTPSGSTTNPNRDNDTYVRYAFEDGLQTHMWVDMLADDTDGIPPVGGDADANDDDDQVTTYTYGVTSTDSPAASTIAANNLLRQVQYPDSTSDIVRYAYNAQGEQITMVDQEGNAVASVYDPLGRPIERQATLDTNSDLDDAVLRIVTGYDDRGMVEAVTQYDDPTSGDVVDQVAYEYDHWGLLDKIYQDFNSVVTAGSGDELTVGYTHGTYTSPTARALRRTGITLPDGTAITYQYAATGGALDAAINRVSSVKVGTTTVATYEYLGLAEVVGTELPEPELLYNRFTPGASSGEYARLDVFGRVEHDIWTRGIDTDSNGSYDAYRDFYDHEIGWSMSSSIDLVQDKVYPGWDVAYTNDGLERLATAERGDWDGINEEIDGPRFLENWTLSQTGNWDLHQLDLDGDSSFGGTDELNDTGTFNLVNELRYRDKDSDTTDDVTLGYDDLGNLTDDGEDYKYIYDVWGRLRKVTDRSDNLVAEYTYNGLGHRTGWHYDADADSTVEANTSGNSDDPWYHWVYDDNWRQVAIYRVLHYNAGGGWTWDEDINDNVLAKEDFVFHNAGLAGYGSSSYIDSVILRDADSNTSWSAASDGTLEERTYYCQSWRADVVALLSDAGQLIQQGRYDPYGVPFGLSKADVDADGDVDSDDATLWGSLYSGGTHPYADWNFDGVANSTDYTAFLNSYTSDTELGRGILGYDGSVTGGNSRKGYAGYELDPELYDEDPSTSKAWQGWYHVRHRLYACHSGRWSKRDPLGYIDGPNLYAMSSSALLTESDPFGLAMGRGSGGCGAGGCGGDGGDRGVIVDEPELRIPEDGKSLKFLFRKCKKVPCPLSAANRCAQACKQAGYDGIRGVTCCAGPRVPRSPVRVGFIFCECGYDKPKNCDEATRDRLQKEVTEYCKDIQKRGATCEDKKRWESHAAFCRRLWVGVNVATRCMHARNAINVQCYNGGDPGHRWAAMLAREHRQVCIAKMRSNCPGSSVVPAPHPHE